MWVAKQAKAEVIERDNFLPSIRDLAGASPEEQTLAYIRYARFADQQQQVLSRGPTEVDQMRMTSSAKRHQVKDLQNRVRVASQQNNLELANSLTRHSKRLEIELQDDAARLEAATTTRLAYLATACKMYAKALLASDTQDDKALRLCSLWLEQSGTDEVNQEIKNELLRVPTRKFVPLVRQLTARMQQESQPSPFQANLGAVLLRMCHEHPFHVLYNIITQAQALRQPPKRRQSGLQGSPRESAALNVLNKMKASSRADLLAEMDRFAHAAMTWSMERSDSKTHRPIMPSHAPMAQLKDMHIPVATADLLVDPTCKYQDIATLQGYDLSYSIAGGLSRPKIMRCRASDGQLHIELVGAFETEFEAR